MKKTVSKQSSSQSASEAALSQILMQAVAQMSKGKPRKSPPPTAAQEIPLDRFERGRSPTVRPCLNGRKLSHGSQWVQHFEYAPTAIQRMPQKS